MTISQMLTKWRGDSQMRNAISFTSRTQDKRLVHRRVIHRLDLRALNSSSEMFCSGRCTEATCFEQLCKACVNEYFDFQKERHEY